ncbi:MAG TPA: GAF domain-containing protein [Ktedonobacterales bacterium]|nr:GAF domain-containing protein [Ktedonobacterales bacterium]
MSEFARAAQAHTPRIRAAVEAHLTAQRVELPERELDALLAALDPDTLDRWLAHLERTAREQGMRGGRVDARLESLHDLLDRLAAAVREALAHEPAALAAGERWLAHVVAASDSAVVRGNLAGAEEKASRDALVAGSGASYVQALRRINSAANSTLDLGETLQTTVRTVAEEMHADLCSLFLFDDFTRELQLRATNGPRPRAGAHFTLGLGRGYSGWVAEHGHPLVEYDASANEQFAEEAGAYPTPFRGLLSMPIIIFTAEKLMGVISVQSAEARAFTPDEVSFLEVVAGQLAMNIENGRLYEQTDETLRRQIHELSTLHRVSALVASTLELDDVLRMIVMQAVQLVGADRSIIFTLDRAGQRLEPVATHGFEDRPMPGAGVAVGRCCAGRAVSTGEPALNLDCMHTEEECYFHDTPEAVSDVQSVLCVPLVSTHGSQGALCVYRPQRYMFGPHQLQLVVTFANVAAIAMENARLFEQTREGLKARGVLLREMHHRVKNNLQQVASILSMQRRRAKSPQVERILTDSIGRIQGIAATHDLLSREQVAIAAVDDIARKIVAIVQSNLVPPQLHLEMRVAPSTVQVPSQQATTLAIILNELIANAIEHGFGARARGHIVITAARAGEDILVSVADDGQGVPAGFDAATSDSLGLQLVRSLGRSDLDAEFALRSGVARPDADLNLPDMPGPWTVAQLRFPAALEGDAALDDGEPGETAH